MKKIVKLTENDLMKIVKRVIKENEGMGESEMFEIFRREIGDIFTNIEMVEHSSELEDLYMDLVYMENKIIDNKDKLSNKEYDMLMDNINICRENIEDIEDMSYNFEDGEEEDDDDDDITSYNTKWIMPSDDM